MTSPTIPPLSSFLFGNTVVNPSGATSLVSGSGIPYRYLPPTKIVPGTKYPVILFLHGTGEEGTDGVAHLAAANNTAHGALYLVSTDNPPNATNYPCFFIAPQLPTGQNWSQDPAAAWITSLYKTFTAVFGASIDPAQWHITGLSLGAFGAYDLPGMLSKQNYLGKNPFASCVPLSGNYGEFGGGNAAAMPKLPIWCFHGVADPTVPITADDQGVIALRAAGFQVIQTRYTTGQHDIWEVAYQHPLLLPWMMSQRLGQPSPGIPNFAAYVGGARTDYGGVTTDNVPAVTPPTPPTPPPTGVTNLALNKTVTVSSVDDPSRTGNLAVDGNATTRWSSSYADNQWIEVDLGANHSISEIDLTWEVACGKNYLLQSSLDGTNWILQNMVTGNTATGLLKYTYATPFTARYVRMLGETRATQWGFSLYELAVYGV